MTTNNRKSKAATEFAVFSIGTVFLVLIAIIIGTENIYSALASLFVATATTLVSVLAYRDFYAAIEQDVEQEKAMKFYADCDRQYNDMLLAHEAEEQWMNNVIENLERENELNHVCGSKEDFSHE
jgi:hypothetical protein